VLMAAHTVLRAFDVPVKAAAAHPTAAGATA
jgi:hypothetical protein